MFNKMLLSSSMLSMLLAAPVFASQPGEAEPEQPKCELRTPDNKPGDAEPSYDFCSDEVKTAYQAKKRAWQLSHPIIMDFKGGTPPAAEEKPEAHESTPAEAGCSLATKPSGGAGLVYLTAAFATMAALLRRRRQTA